MIMSIASKYAREAAAYLCGAVGFVGLGLWFVTVDMGPNNAREYPAPLVTWARNMNGRIEGAQCEATGDAMVCDVRIDGGTLAKVNCAGQKCWLQWTQDSCKK